MSPQAGEDGLCNSPGDVPTFSVADTSNLLGTSAGNSTQGSVTILAAEDVGNTPYTSPPGEPEVQTISVYDLELSASDKFDGNPEFVLYLGQDGGPSPCLRWNASAADVQTAISDAATSSANAMTTDDDDYGVGVVVTRSEEPDDEIWGLPSSPAPNGYTWTITYAGYNGDVPNPGDSGGLRFETGDDCSPGLTGWQRVEAQTLVDGDINPVACDTDGCVDGVVLREDFTVFSVPDDSCSATINTVPWNATENVIKTKIEACNTERQVDVSRSVIDKYGTMEWEVTFTKNPGTTPTGAGDVAELSVAQGSAVLPPLVIETQKGSTGLSGTFTLDYNDPGGSREVRFDEDVNRMRRKLEEMSTISDVYVELEEYPSADEGGWGGTAVDDDTPGGYVWKVRFLTVPGTYNGKTFPAGTGNVDAIVPSTSSLSGASATVVTTTVTEGADEMGGGFALSFADQATETLLYTADETAVEAVLEDLSNIGDVSVSFDPYTPTRIANATVTVGRDGSFAEISSVSDLRNFLSPGVVIRIGGEDASTDGTLVGTNGEGLLDYPGGEGHRRVSPYSVERLDYPKYDGTHAHAVTDVSCLDVYSTCGLLPVLSQRRMES